MNLYSIIIYRVEVHDFARGKGNMMESKLQKMMRAAGYLNDAGLEVINKYSTAILFSLAGGDENTIEVLADSAFGGIQEVASHVFWIDSEPCKQGNAIESFVGV